MATQRPYFNDSTTILVASAVKTGSTVDTTIYDGFLNPFGGHSFTAIAVASHASGTLGFKIEMSNDGTTWRTAAQATTVADVPSVLTVYITTRYYRVKYTNAGTDQTYFMLNSAIVD